MVKTKSNDGWENVDSGAIAMSSTRADYKENGKHFVESGFDFTTASVKDIKAKLGDMKPGETKTLNSAHTWTLQKQISSSPGEKSCKFRLVEQDGLNDGTPVEGNTNTSYTNLGSEPSNDPDKKSDDPRWKIFKNLWDKHFDWLLVLSVGVTAALVLAGVALVR